MGGLRVQEPYVDPEGGGEGLEDLHRADPDREEDRVVLGRRVHDRDALQTVGAGVEQAGMEAEPTELLLAEGGGLHPAHGLALGDRPQSLHLTERGTVAETGLLHRVVDLGPVDAGAEVALLHRVQELGPGVCSRRVLIG